MTIKYIQELIPDKIRRVTVENGVTVVHITSGRIKIMPKHRKPKIGYSLRHGGIIYEPSTY